jgi:hypothetical protein
LATIKKFHVSRCSGGNCECLWELDYRPLGMNGKRRRLRFKTRKEAERFLAETAHRAAQGEYIEPAKIPSFEEVAEDWLRGKTDRRPSHFFDLQTRLAKHILPIFGAHKLDRISVASVERFRNDLRDRGYAFRTINTILRIMSAVFRLGIRRGQCTKNPLDSVERAVQIGKELKAEENALDTGNDPADSDSVLSPPEIQALLASARASSGRCSRRPI